MGHDVEASAQAGRKLREELGLPTPEVPFDSFDDVERPRRRNEDDLAHYDTKQHKVVFYRRQSEEVGGIIAVHEHEHARQAEKLSGVDVDSSYWEILEEAGLATCCKKRGDRRHHDGFGVEYTEGDLMSYLPRLGYDMGLLASYISDYAQLKSNLREFEQQIEDSEWATELQRSITKSLAEAAEECGVDGFGNTEDHQPVYSRDTLEILERVHDLLKNQKENGETLRWNEPKLSAEREGFAYFLTDVVNEQNPGLYQKSESAKTAGSLREENEHYQTPVPGTDQTVGDAAADRVDELFEVKRNLEQHGGMDEKEAVQYILNEVQERKIDHAASQIPEYEDISDIEERLEKSRNWP